MAIQAKVETGDLLVLSLKGREKVRQLFQAQELGEVLDHSQKLLKLLCGENKDVNDLVDCLCPPAANNAPMRECLQKGIQTLSKSRGCQNERHR